jgi:hypothetical protein
MLPLWFSEGRVAWLLREKVRELGVLIHVDGLTGEEFVFGEYDIMALLGVLL